jgi:hypothetical protein
MDPIIINLSAPIYGSDGTGVVPSTADERVEAPDAVLAALTSAFRRLLARPGPRRGDLIAIFGKQLHSFASHSCTKSTNIDGMRVQATTSTSLSAACPWVTPTSDTRAAVAMTSASTATPPVTTTTRPSSFCRMSLLCWSVATCAGATSAKVNQSIRSRAGSQGW